jgi:hypothetical protein
MIPLCRSGSGSFRRTQDGDRATRAVLRRNELSWCLPWRTQSTWIPLLRLVQADKLKAVGKAVFHFPLYTLTDWIPPLPLLCYRRDGKGIWLLWGRMCSSDCHTFLLRLFRSFVFSARRGCLSTSSKPVILSEAPSRYLSPNERFMRAVEGPRRCLSADAVKSFPTTNLNRS